MVSIANHIRQLMAHRFWSRHHQAEDLVSWMHEPVVRNYINESVSGSPNVWPMEWFRSFIPRTFARGVSIGCGLGALERDLASKGICAQLVGVDISQAALDKAAERARDEGFDSIAYQKGDFNAGFLDADESFDIAFFHQALHHVENLDSCLSQVADSLDSKGWLFLDEYFGPSRAEWQADRDLMRSADQAFEQLPRSARRRDRLELPVDWRDPSEAIRSSEIREHAERYFAQIEMRGYGGNLVALIYPHLAHDTLAQEDKDEVLMQLIEAERQLLATGVPPYYALWIGEKIPTSRG